jgi:cytochrome c oxidase subunit 3
MAVAMGAVAMTFGALLLAYAIVRAQAPSWPPPGEAAVPGPWPWPLLATAAALAASFAMRAARAHGGASVANGRGVRHALVAAAVAGSAFIGVQLAGWFSLLAAGVRPSDGVVTSVVYALTLFHAVHAVAALIALTPLLVRVLRGGTVPVSALAAVSAFWHLVAIVWIVVFLAVFVV